MATQAQNPVGDEELEEFIVEVIRANTRGVSAIRNVTMEPNWSFGQSMFFAGTVITTIGIPLTLILVAAIVERLLIPATLLLQCLNARLGNLYQPFNIRLVHFCVLCLIVVGFFFVIPSAIFASIEPGWNFLDAFYYCYISLTTIGLGDYIPGDSPDQKLRPLYKVFTTGYLIIGLIFMMLILAVLYDIPQLNLSLHFLMKSDEQDDSEKVHLHTAAAASGPKYTQHLDEDGPNMMSPASEGP
ncbi:PREDICTED: potassium channel subfamily K member 1-like [Priapulus caudatus]|uniref:Potassium channel subfamily K member 1-like n=1 Tax=Priapulus caudatus TaxID=37621 RepID=A0ABM1EWI2_PRICU|nr:PREDICTED: potassium channel subfamily K member 1-like [Priapulus caudatus]